MLRPKKKKKGESNINEEQDISLVCAWLCLAIVAASKQMYTHTLWRICTAIISEDRMVTAEIMIRLQHATPFIGT
jgi:hypothetical protein